MYITKFSAFNFRSLRQVFVRFEKGKNVIVGKNNSGKSNIIKAIEILIGERFPSYINFSDNDFYTYEEVDTDTGEIKEIISENFYLEVELEGRDFDEDLINKIKKQTAFSKVESAASLFNKNDAGEFDVNYDFFQSLDDIEAREEIVILETYPSGKSKKTEWKKPDSLLNFLKGAKKIKLFFCKSRLDEEKVGFGIICVDATGSIWVSHFLSKKLRDSLITTTVISALRSQKEDMRLVHYTWYGKLIMGLWEKNRTKEHPTKGKTYDELIREKSLDIKDFVDSVFDKDTAEIRKLLEGAIAHKTISFRFMNDMQNEMYKNIQLFVNDGIDRPLHEKGTGIQSAIIISLFSLYCNNFHNSSSLLIAEEPELYLHPQARRVISAELDKFINSSKDQPRQLIISTHSVEYLKNVDPYDIIRTYKDIEKNCSIVKQLDIDTSQQLTLEIKRFLWSNNTEMFFADKVVLVEGGELYLLPSLVDKITSSKQLLDYLNISVVRVNGKGSFLVYAKMLECFDIPFVILSDLDCLKDEISKLIGHLKIPELTDEINKIRKAISEISVDYDKIKDKLKDAGSLDGAKLKQLFEKVVAGELNPDDEDLLETVKYVQSRNTRDDFRSTIIDTIGEESFDNVQQVLYDNGIFIWEQGDLESCYTETAKTIRGSKDLKALELSYILKDDAAKIDDYMNNVEEIKDLVDLIVG
jgi:predicted ATP-dependent endonuclease of OLD family